MFLSKVGQYLSIQYSLDFLIRDAIETQDERYVNQKMPRNLPKTTSQHYRKRKKKNWIQQIMHRKIDQESTEKSQ